MRPLPPIWCCCWRCWRSKTASGLGAHSRERAPRLMTDMDRMGAEGEPGVALTVVVEMPAARVRDGVRRYELATAQIGPDGMLGSLIEAFWALRHELEQVAEVSRRYSIGLLGGGRKAWRGDFGALMERINEGVIDISG